MTKKAKTQSDEMTLVLTTTRVLRHHLSEGGRLKHMSDGAAKLDEALKPFADESELMDSDQS